MGWPKGTQYHSPRIRVQVKRHHISLGKACDQRMCAISLALSEQLEQPITVGRNMFGAWIGSKLRLFKLPEKAVEWMRGFDSGQKMEPFWFDLT